MKTNCSVCGSPVIHHCGDEGTQYYEALYPKLEKENKIMRQALDDLYYGAWDMADKAFKIIVDARDEVKGK